MTEVALAQRLSRAIAQLPCSCTELDSCEAHELLDELVPQRIGAPPEE